MLKTRVISAVMGLILLFAAIMSTEIILSIAVFILSIMAIYEFNGAISNIGIKPVKWGGYVACVLIPIAGIIKEPEYILFYIFVILLLLFSQQIISYPKYNLTDISTTILSIFYGVFMFLFIVLIRRLEYGIFFIWIVFIGAWATDTFAYFGGVTLGKRKLIPSVSPNKTVAGAVSGVIGSILAICLYGLLVKKSMGHISYHHYVVMGILCGIIAQVGDLVASTIKRYTKIKDFGSILPGHGGVLDRFDSVLLVAPAIYFYVTYIIK